MESTISITVRARPETVFTLATDVEGWPRLLPHYRFVRRLRGGERRRLLEMAARRDVIPLRWRAMAASDEDQLLIHFRHVRGPTRGMDVRWRFEAEGDGGCRVSIWHRYRHPLPLFGRVYEWVAFHVFIENVAGKTLRYMKAAAEVEEARIRSSEGRPAVPPAPSADAPAVRRTPR